MYEKELHQNQQNLVKVLPMVDLKRNKSKTEIKKIVIWYD